MMQFLKKISFKNIDVCHNYKRTVAVQYKIQFPHQPYKKRVVKMASTTEH